MWRQGDVFIEEIKPGSREKQLADMKQTPIPHGVMVHGEVTGHSHRIKDLSTAQLFAGKAPGEMFMEVSAPTTQIVHEEHGTIELKKGLYRVWRQREYSPEAIRFVYD